MKINENFDNLAESYLFSDIAKRRREYQKKHPEAKIISLGIGDVSLPFPKVIVDALVSSSLEMGCKETFRGYPPEYGYEFLKDAIVKYYLEHKCALKNNEVFVSDGAKSDLGNLIDILGEMDALIPDPVYPVYVDSNLMCGRKVIYLNGNKENGFLPLPDGVEEKEYIIYLCSPNNPTGAVYNKEQLSKWVDFAIKTKSLIVFDAAYEAFINGDYPRSIYEVEGSRKCAIEICSFSKLAGFTGLRCSWMIVPEELEEGKINKIWSRRQATKFNGVAYPVQRAAEKALSNEGLKACRDNIKQYLGNAKIIAEVLKKHDIWYTGGTSSPYIWMKCPKSMKSFEFFDFLLENANIIGTPGSGFGKNGEGYFRLTAFATKEDTIEASTRLDAALNKLLK